MTDYTPTTADVRRDYATRMAPFWDYVRFAEFDHWLAQTIREAKAEALREAATLLKRNNYRPFDHLPEDSVIPDDPRWIATDLDYYGASAWLEARACELEQGQTA